MLKLANRNHAIPGGIQWLQPETNFKVPSGVSFNRAVDAVVAHRIGNPWITKKHNLATDWETVANEVEHANALRMQGNPKWRHFLGADDGGASFVFPFPHLSQLANAAGAVKKTVAGVKVLLRWLGSSGRSVDKSLAENRATTCSICPKNKPGDWKTWFNEEASREILVVFGIMQDLKLATSKDIQLGVCSACLCPLKSKVWAPLAHIAAELKPEVKADLNQENPRCWILTEMGE